MSDVALRGAQLSSVASGEALLISSDTAPAKGLVAASNRELLTKQDKCLGLYEVSSFVGLYRRIREILSQRA